MLKNYLIIAIRNLFRQKLYTGINVLGLALGLSCCMLILLYITDELRYDKFHTKGEHIYRVNWESRLSSESRPSATTCIPLGEAIIYDLPEVEAMTRLYNRSGSMKVSDNENSDIKFQERDVHFVDSTFARIFTLNFLKGNPSQALTAPNTVVITDAMAQKYFGKEEALGKTLLYEDSTLLKITGIVEKLPAHTDLAFDFLVSFETLFLVESEEIANYLKSDWLYNPAYTYILLKPGYTPESAEKNLSALLHKYADERVKQHISLSLQPLHEIHLYAADIESNPSESSITYIYIFITIALITLLIASVNFINFAIAHSLKRAREVGLRKVMGARRRQLIVQFLGESVLVCLCAFLLAFLFTQQFLPLLNDITNKQLTLELLGNVYILLFYIALLVVTSLLAGIYPAFVIARFEPVKALKEKLGGVGKGGTLRKVLIITQFAASFILMVGAVIIYEQLQYLRNKPLGFQKEHILEVPLFGSNASWISYAVDGNFRGRMNAFENELIQYSGITAITAASSLPGSGFVRGLVIPEGFTEQDNLFVPWISVDYDFVSSFQIPLVAGRDFSKDTGTDHLQAFIINESAVRMFGWKTPEEAIGKAMIRGDQQNGKKGEVVGVIKDFHFNTLAYPLGPLIIDVGAGRFTVFAIRLQSERIPETITYIKQQWDKTFPERVFEYSFLDENIDALYNVQEGLSKTMGYLAGLAILISCMGLFGLASLMTVQRTKEIGIRKVLGAGVSSIVKLLSKDLLILVGVALLIGAPIAWYIMHRWLQDFAYRVEVGWQIWVAAGITALLLAWLTVSYQTIKAALTNPVESLKNE